jgi:hypothetical protein
MKKIGIYILLVLLLSCEELTEWEEKGSFVPRLIVEGFLTNQPAYNYVKLSLPVVEGGAEARMISGAIVIISDGNIFEVLNEDADNPGYYYPGREIRGVVNKDYLLYIKFNEFEFTAGATMVPVGPMSEFSWRRVDSEEDLYRINPQNGSDPSMTRYIVEWNDSSGAHSSVFYHYQIQSVDVNEFFKPATESLEFPGNARIIRQKYSLSPNHQRFIRSLLSETEWKGGWFDILPGNLHTNLSAGGAGFFAASSLVVDTVYFEVREQE